MSQTWKILGVDLASQPKKTGACILAGGPGGLRLERLDLGCTDSDLLALARTVDVVAIDSPFGWPRAFTELVGRHADNSQRGPGAWAWDEETQRSLRLRETDLWVWKNVLGRPPLSVSTDKIALPAMRCSGLLAALGVQDRSGDGRVFEVYPAAALERWIGKSSGYKNGAAAVQQLGEIADALEARLNGLRLPVECRRSDDALDAVVAALVGAVARLGAVEPVPDELREAAATEGWIAVPTVDALDRLRRAVAS